MEENLKSGKKYNVMELKGRERRKRKGGKKWDKEKDEAKDK